VSPENTRQIELLTDGLILNKLYSNTRLHVDKNRFSQISQVVDIIVSSSSDNKNNQQRRQNNSNSTEQVTHPAIALQSLDDLILDIKRNNSYLWKSETLCSLISRPQWTSSGLRSSEITRSCCGASEGK
jgi:hypothetical protein